MLKVGDKVRVIGNTNQQGFCHILGVGSTGTVTECRHDMCRLGVCWVLNVDLESVKDAHEHYNKLIIGKDGIKTAVDVYRVLEAFNVTNPQLQHIVKKALCAGQRGHKDYLRDLQDIVDSAKNAIEMEQQKGGYNE